MLTIARNGGGVSGSSVWKAATGQRVAILWSVHVHAVCVGWPLKMRCWRVRNDAPGWQR